MNAKISFEIEKKLLSRYIAQSSNSGIILFMGMINAFFLAPIAKGKWTWQTFVLTTLTIWGIAFVCLLYSTWYTRRWVDSISYELDHDLVRINQGVFTQKRSAIPVDKVIDVMAYQTWDMRQIGFWSINLQTAGGGESGVSNMLYALANPKAVQTLLLDARRTQSGKN